jgi:hypothetical protein
VFTDDTELQNRQICRTNGRTVPDMNTSINSTARLTDGVTSFWAGLGSCATGRGQGIAMGCAQLEGLHSLQQKHYHSFGVLQQPNTVDCLGQTRAPSASTCSIS